MKKLTIAVLIAVLCIATAFAADKGMEIGGAIALSNIGFGQSEGSVNSRQNVEGPGVYADFRMDLDGQFGIYAKLGFTYGLCYTQRRDGANPSAINIGRGSNGDLPLSLNLVDIDAGVLYNFDFKSSKFGVAAGAGIDAAVGFLSYEDEYMGAVMSLGLEVLVEANYRISDSLVLFCDIEPKLSFMMVAVEAGSSEIEFGFLPTGGYSVSIGTRYAF